MFMKRIKYLFVLTLGVLLLSGCKSNYEPVTYSKFIEEFNNNSNYYVNDDTLKYENLFERYVTVSGKSTEFTFYEFKTEEDAKEYVDKNYKDNDRYKYKSSNDYVIVKSTKDKYFYGILVDKIFVVGQTSNKSYKSDVNKIMKELGY